RDKTLAVGQRLFAYVVCWYQGEIRLTHFDVIPKNLIKTHLQGFNASALALTLLQACHPACMALRLVYEVIERGIVARTDEPTITDRGRRLIHDSACEQRHDLVLTAAVVAESTQQRCLAVIQGRAYCRQPSQRSTQRRQVPGVRRATGDTPEQALDVVDVPQRLA